jgi:hypothetical protein
VLPEELDLLELLLSPPPEEDGVVVVPELEDEFPLSSPPPFSPQERVNVMASPRVAANVIFENCVLIVLPPFLWVKNSNAKGSHGGLPVHKNSVNPENSVNFGSDKVYCLYIYLYDKRMTMVLAAPVKPQGIEKEHIGANIEKIEPNVKGFMKFIAKTLVQYRL